MFKSIVFSVLVLVSQALLGHAGTVSGIVVSGSGQAGGGVTMSVATSGFEFTPLIGSLIQPSATGVQSAPLPPQGINVSAALRNHTGQDITFVLGVTATPKSPSFEFRVYNANGGLVWDSLGRVTIPISRLFALKSGQALRGSAFIPLFINGVALPAGSYTLVSSLYGTPEFSTTTSFVVNNVIAIN